MRYHIISVGCALIVSLTAYSKEYTTRELTIHSDLDERLVQLALETAQVYYKDIRDSYFSSVRPEPLLIYCSDTALDSERLLQAHGHHSGSCQSYYVSSIPAAYAFARKDGQSPCSWDSLFEAIAAHFVHSGFPGAPEWFKTGLRGFLSNGVCIFEGKIVVGTPCPRGARMLMDAIEEQDTRLSIRKLFTLSDEGFRLWDVGPHFTRALFCWIYQNGYLPKYLESTRKNGYELSVLEEALGSSWSQMNSHLHKFIKTDYYAAAYLNKAMSVSDKNAKEQALLNAIELKPDYCPAKLELARFYLENGDSKQSRNILSAILLLPDNVDYRRAAALMGSIFYKEDRYYDALDYFNKAWHYSDYWPYKYQIAYKMANCCYYLKDQKDAAQWYKKFVDLNWQPDQDKAAVEFAKNYLTAAKQWNRPRARSSEPLREEF